MKIRITFLGHLPPCIGTLGEIGTTRYGRTKMARICPSVTVQPTAIDMVITNLTIRGTELQHIDDMLLTQRLHERLLTEHPTDSTRVKECEAVVLRENFRSVIGTVILYKIPVEVVISSTEYPVLTKMRRFGTRRITLTTPVSHSTNCMITESTVIVQLS